MYYSSFWTKIIRSHKGGEYKEKLTIELLCSKCSFVEEDDKTNFTITNANLICKECFLEVNKGKF
jgi:hypothetical protein